MADRDKQLSRQDALAEGFAALAQDLEFRPTDDDFLEVLESMLKATLLTRELETMVGHA